MKKPVFLLDNGHGVETPGKRSPVWGDGVQLLEYEFTRDIVERIHSAIKSAGVFSVVLVPEKNDVSLGERVRRANRYSDAILVSVHANAGGGSGFEVFTSKGNTASDTIAEMFCKEAISTFPEFRLRTDLKDGDSDKEEDFFILKNTNCPAILTENLFMDTEKDCRVLLSEIGRKRIADYHINAIKKINNQWLGNR